MADALKVYIETYGCQMNVADSELMLGVLGREGYQQTPTPEDADVMLVNTCAVRDNAEQRVVGRVGELQRFKRNGTVLGVVGCMAQRLGPELLAQSARVDLVVGGSCWWTLPEKWLPGFPRALHDKNIAVMQDTVLTGTSSTTETPAAAVVPWDTSFSVPDLTPEQLAAIDAVTV